MAVRSIKNLQGTYSVFVNGQWSSTARLDGVVENTNPWDVEHIYGNVSESDESMIDEACTAAARNLGRWQEMGPQLRNNAVSFVVATLKENAAKLATILTRELGKTAADAQEEIDETLSLLTTESAAPYPVSGRSHSQGPQHASAVLIITPFSGAVAIPMSQLLSVLLAGNTVVWTPSPLAPESSQAVAQIVFQGIQAAAVQAGQEFPPGAFSMLLGGAACSSVAMQHSQISAVEFTGSKQAAGQVASELFALGKECHLHTAGPNQLYVHKSADLDVAARRFMVAKTQSAGQRCTSVQELLCDQAVYEELLKRVLELADNVVAGASNSALLADADSDPSQFSLPPLVNKAAQRQCQKLVSQSVEEGASLLYQQEVSRDLRRAGFYVPFTLLGNVSKGNVAYDAEFMGPIGILTPVSDMSEALAIIKDKGGQIAAIAATDRGLIRSFEQQTHGTVAFWRV